MRRWWRQPGSFGTLSLLSVPSVDLQQKSLYPTLLRSSRTRTSTLLELGLQLKEPPFFICWRLKSWMLFFLQEPHSDKDNEGGWRSEWPGQLCAGVERDPLLPSHQPHPASSARLKRRIESHHSKDAWRGFHGRSRQFTLVHCRLDGFYWFKHILSVFKSYQTVRVGLSDHSLFHCAVIQNFKTGACWHFNTALLADRSFNEAFSLVWLLHREKKVVALYKVAGTLETF